MSRRKHKGKILANPLPRFQPMKRAERAYFLGLFLGPSLITPRWVGVVEVVVTYPFEVELFQLADMAIRGEAKKAKLEDQGSGCGFGVRDLVFEGSFAQAMRFKRLLAAKYQRGSLPEGVRIELSAQVRITNRHELSPPSKRLPRQRPVQRRRKRRKA